jgi:hypothetical protein
MAIFMVFMVQACSGDNHSTNPASIAKSTETTDADETIPVSGVKDAIKEFDIPEKTARTYELKICPTDDAQIRMKDPDNNYGSGSGMTIRNRYGHPYHPAYWQQDGLIRFDLSSIPGEARISEAKLNLYYYNYKDNNPAGRDLACFMNLADWDEESVTWNRQPERAPYPTSISIIPSEYEWMNWDVTRDVQIFVAGEESNYGWCVSDTTYWGRFNIPMIRFYSKEKGEHIPFLLVKYEY